MKSDVVDVSLIFEFVRGHRSLPCGYDGVYGHYSKLCDVLTAHIPETSGWYFWMRSKDGKRPIYIGKAEKTSKKNSLRYRINKELKTERICFWSDVVGKEKALDDQHKAYNGRYDGHGKRALKKAGTRFIVWVSDSDVTSAEVREVERILIDRYNPKANIQRAKRSRAFEKAEDIVSVLLHRL